MKRVLYSIIFIFLFIACQKTSDKITAIEIGKNITDTFPSKAFWYPITNYANKVPVAYISTKGNTIVNEPKVQSVIQIQIGDTIVFRSNIGIEYRGSTSFRLFDQKSYGF